MTPEMRDVVPGLWLWRLEYPGWRPRSDWGPVVASACAEAGGELALIDPLAPPDDAREIWARLDARPPTLVLVLKPDHVRDVDVFVRRYGTRALGPRLSGATTFPKPSSSRSSPATSFPAASSRCTTAAAGTRRRCGCPSSAHSCSRTR